MLLESEFETFRNRLIEKYKKVCEEKIKEATIYRDKKILEAQKKGKSVYTEGIQLFAKDLENRKRKHFLKIQLEEKKKINLEYKKIEEKLIEIVRQKISKDFESFVSCFSNWLKRNYKEGTVKTQEKYFRYFEGFEKIKTKDKKVVFEKEDLVVELSPDRIIDDYKEILKQVIFSQLKES